MSHLTDQKLSAEQLVEVLKQVRLRLELLNNENTSRLLEGINPSAGNGQPEVLTQLQLQMRRLQEFPGMSKAPQLEAATRPATRMR